MGARQEANKKERMVFSFCFNFPGLAPNMQSHVV